MIEPHAWAFVQRRRCGSGLRPLLRCFWPARRPSPQTGRTKDLRQHPGPRCRHRVLHAGDRDKTQDAHTRGGALFFRAFGREKKKDIDGAIADLSESIKIDPNPGSAYSARGQIYHQTGDEKKPSPT